MAKLPRPGDGSPESERSELPHLLEFYVETGNVAAAWRCWHLARKHGLPVPDAIMAEIERFGEAIAVQAGRAMHGDPNVSLDNAKVGALWANRAHGSREPAGALFEWQRNLTAGVQVYLDRVGGFKMIDARRRAAAKNRMSESSVRDAERMIGYKGGLETDTER